MIRFTKSFFNMTGPYLIPEPIFLSYECEIVDHHGFGILFFGTSGSHQQLLVSFNFQFCICMVLITLTMIDVFYKIH